MRILFFDDDPTRHRRFGELMIGHDVTHAATIEEACKALAEDAPFDLVSLDHDLDKHTCRLGESGRDVSRFIIEILPRNRHPRSIVIHSCNVVAAEAMERDFLGTGIPVSRVPFTREKEKLLLRALAEFERRKRRSESVMG